MGWILGEVLQLTADGELITPTELLYLAAGVATVALGALNERRIGRSTGNAHEEGAAP